MYVHTLSTHPLICGVCVCVCCCGCSGLEDQLLGIVVAEERPDLEEAKNTLIINNAKMKQELKEIEDNILSRLTNAEGSPVDDEDLISALQASKAKSQEIQVCLYPTCIYMYIIVRTCTMYVCIHMYMYMINVCTYVYTCTYMYMYIIVHVCIIYTYTCLCSYYNNYIHVCVDLHA